jgi:hypothetical protein
MPVKNEKCIQNIGHKSFREEITWKKIYIIKDLRKIGCEEMGWFVMV